MKTNVYLIFRKLKGSLEEYNLFRHLVDLLDTALFYSSKPPNKPAAAPNRPPPNATTFAAAAPVEDGAAADPDFVDPEGMLVPEICVRLAVVALAPIPVVALAAPLLPPPVAVVCAPPLNFSAPAVTVIAAVPTSLAS